ncbi:MAG: VOC family protein [Saprospiraceae bacterium]|nr:VOC family protein [Saprospiraceae bacterium]
MKINGIVCTLQVHDLDRSISFYNSIGFSLDWKWPESDPTHASLSTSGHSFMLVQIDIKNKPQIGDLYFRVEEVEKIHQELIRKKIQVSKLVKTDYGMLDFSIESPSGHHLVFGQPSGEWNG